MSENYLQHDLSDEVKEQIRCSKRLAHALADRNEVSGDVDGIATTIEWLAPSEFSHSALYQVTTDISNTGYSIPGITMFDRTHYFCDDSLHVLAMHLVPQNGDKIVILREELDSDDITHGVIYAVNAVLEGNGF